MVSGNAVVLALSLGVGMLLLWALHVEVLLWNVIEGSRCQEVVITGESTLEGWRSDDLEGRMWEDREELDWNYPLLGQEFAEDAYDLDDLPLDADFNRIWSSLMEQNIHSGFAWEQCGSARDPIRLQTMNVSPSIFPSKGNVTLVDFRASTSMFLSSPIKARVAMFKRADKWVQVPCISGQIGSCTYNDLCSLVPFAPGKPCPAVFQRYKVPCRCPIPKGTYEMHGLNGSLYSRFHWLAQGDYLMRMVMAGKKNRLLACFDVAFTMQ